MEEQIPIGVLFLGDASVGKTTIIHKQCNGTTDPVPTISTASFPVNFEGTKFVIFDTAGQERFRSASTFFYHKASIAVIIFDVSNIQSFQNLDYWINSLHDYIDQLKLIIVGNKIDLGQSFELENIKNYAEDLNCPYILTSATSGAGVNELFHLIAQIASSINTSIETDGSLEMENDSQKNSSCC